MTARGQPLRQPSLYIIAGPNGAGKTTFARRFLPFHARCHEFVNADLIAQGLSPFKPEAMSRPAGRLMLQRIRELAVRRADFGVETTLSGRSYVPLFKKLARSGYYIHLDFLWLSLLDLSIARVAERVRKGGHDIPRDVLRRRYPLSIRNLFHLYLPLLDSWNLFDNSGPDPRLVASGAPATLLVADEELFAKLRREFSLHV